MFRITKKYLHRVADALQGRGNRWARRVVWWCLLATVPPQALAQERHALIIGNAAYAHVEPLRNSVNDADLIARSLGRVGFKVTLLRDATQGAMHKGVFGSPFIIVDGQQFWGNDRLAEVRAERREVADVYFAVLVVVAGVAEMPA